MSAGSKMWVQCTSTIDNVGEGLVFCTKKNGHAGDHRGSRAQWNKSGHRVKITEKETRDSRSFSGAEKASIEHSVLTREKIEREIAASPTTGVLKEFERDEAWEKAVTDWEPPLAATLFQGAEDAVNHPPHYTSHPSGVECVEIVEHFGFNIGNAVKYCWRAGLKNPDPKEDLAKAIWYIKRELERLEKAGGK